MFELGIMNRMAEYGILGLGWVLFIYMMIERRFERQKYAELVVYIVTYFTKVRLLDGSHEDARNVLSADLRIDPPFG